MNSLNINGTVDDSGNNMKDYRFVNADFEGQMSVPIQFLTSEGREQIGKAFKEFGSNTVKAWGDTGGAVWRGIDGIAMSKTAFNNYDNAKEIYKLTGMYPTNYDEFAHEKVAEQYGSYVANPFIAALFRTGGETGQFGYYSGQDVYSLITTGSHGSYQPYKWSKDNGGIIDSWNDVVNVVNGSQKQFNFYGKTNEEINNYLNSK